jgi:5-methyltetrahydrofolate--homocysteine methyltransferase
MADLLTTLRSGRVLLMDGAMGTELQRAGLRPVENAAAWNVLHPERVRAVHQAYLAAGAEVLLSNTFLIHCTSYGEGHVGLPWYGWVAAFDVLGPTAAYRLAAVGPVAGDPAGREFDDLAWLDIPDRCRRRSRHDCCHVPDGALLETCSTPRVRYALQALQRRTTGLPLLLSLTFHRGPDGRLVTASGHAPEWFARRAEGYGAAALGVNCGRDIGMDDVIEIIRRYRQETDLPLFARPNAGTPQRVGDRWVYPHTPAEMAARLPEMLEAGVRMVGGCCGTTPEHIAACRPVVDAWNVRRGKAPPRRCRPAAPAGGKRRP